MAPKKDIEMQRTTNKQSKVSEGRRKKSTSPLGEERRRKSIERGKDEEITLNFVYNVLCLLCGANLVFLTQLLLLF